MKLHNQMIMGTLALGSVAGITSGLIGLLGNLEKQEIIIAQQKGIGKICEAIPQDETTAQQKEAREICKKYFSSL